jgi:hypothetical protein
VPVSLVGGATKTTGIEKYPAYGAVAFTDYANKVSGTVAAYLRKDSTTHWVDAVRALLAVHARETYLDETAAAAAKAATPNDSAGYYFDNMTLGDAIKALAATCLFTLARSGNQLKLQAYTGEAPAAYEVELTAASLQGWGPARAEREIKNKVFVKYGRYAQNSRLSAIVKHEDSINYLGLYDTEIDLSWSNTCIGSDNGLMAARKAQALLYRLVGGQAKVDEAYAPLSLLRLQAGDYVRVNVPEIGPVRIFQVLKKTIDFNTPKGVRLLLVKFLGEV